jgi:hypothetical protein
MYKFKFRFNNLFYNLTRINNIKAHKLRAFRDIKIYYPKVSVLIKYYLPPDNL